MTTYGYVRVSTKDQHAARQLAAMRDFGITAKDVYVEKCSGKDFRRPVYHKLVKKLKRCDLLVVQSIDRLGRNYDEILEQWRLLTKEKQVDILVLDMPLLDTRSRGDLMKNFISDIVLQILSFVAENEHVAIKQRQAEGIAAAKARGVRFGRPAKPLPEQFPYYYTVWQKKEVTATAAAKACNMPLSTFLYKAKRWKKKQISS